MSKDSEERDLPPPYAEAAPSPALGQQQHGSSPLLNPSLYTSHLGAHLSSLPSRLREAQQARSTQQAADDLDLVTRLVPHVEGFLSDIASLPRPPARADLTLVPGSAVPVLWTLSGAAERRREGDLVQLVRVAVPSPLDVSKTGGDSKGNHGGSGASAGPRTGASAYMTTTSGLPPERDWNAVQFDEWGRWDEDAQAAAFAGGEDGARLGSWWWGDERMARRLAAYLQPKPLVKTERRAVQAAVVQAKEEKKSGWGWGRKRAGDSSSGTSSPAPPPDSKPYPTSGAHQQTLDKVNMALRADEVTFRRENAFGVWESMSGWAIVLNVSIRR